MRVEVEIFRLFETGVADLTAGDKVEERQSKIRIVALDVVVVEIGSSLFSIANIDLWRRF